MVELINFISWKHSVVRNIFSVEDGELVDNLFITKLTKVLETLIKLHLFFKQLENSTVTPLFQFIICSVFLNRPIVDSWPLAILCFSFPSNFEKFHLIMWFVVWNVNSASECHMFMWFLVLNWNFKIRCSIYTSEFFFPPSGEKHLLWAWTFRKCSGAFIWTRIENRN